MKKYIAILLCATLALGLGGCKLLDGILGGGAELPNPMAQQENAAAFEALGLTLDAPAGAENISYFIIANEIAEVNFTLGGFDYACRASLKTGDISGVYEPFTEAFTLNVLANGAPLAALAENAASGGRRVSWRVNDAQYSLWCALAPEDAALRACALGVLKTIFTTLEEQIPEPAAAEDPVDFTEPLALDIDLDGDGAPEHVSLEPAMGPDNYQETVALIVASANGAQDEATLPIMGGISAAIAFDIDADGFVELFICGDVASDDYETWLFRYDNGALIAANPADDPGESDADYLFCTAYGSITGIENGVVTIIDVVDVLGSWPCETQFQMKAGSFGLERVPGSVWRYARADALNPLDFEWCAVTAAEFPVMLDGAHALSALPAGTRLVPLDTDGETYLHFITEGGAKGTIELVRNTAPYSWGFLIGGVPEEELFSNLPYAG